MATLLGSDALRKSRQTFCLTSLLAVTESPRF
jgi:hypothetical protein